MEVLNEVDVELFKGKELKVGSIEVEKVELDVNSLECVEVLAEVVAVNIGVE